MHPGAWQAGDVGFPRVLWLQYKYGIPNKADIVLDVRFLPNPFFVSGLEAKSGLAPEVRDFVLSRPETCTFLERMNALLEFTLPHYEREGKSNLTLAFGCTGRRVRTPFGGGPVARTITTPGR